MILNFEILSVYSNIESTKKFNKNIFFNGGIENAKSEVWIKSSKDIVVDSDGVYIIFFPFVRNQGGNDAVFKTMIAITSNESYNNDPHFGYTSTNWSTSSVGGYCFTLKANTNYHVFIKHTASVSHTIDYIGFAVKLSD